jgi:hypothetical protein
MGGAELLKIPLYPINKKFHALLKTGRGYWQMVKYWPKYSKTTAVFYDGQFGRNYRLFLKMI